MTKAERIKLILAHDHNVVKDVKVLEAASDEVLTALEASNESLKAAAKKAADAEDDAAKSKKDAEAADEKVKAMSAKPKTMEEYLKDAPEELKSLVANHKAAEEAAKTDLVTKLKAAGAFTEDELKAKSLPELTKLATLAKLEAPATTDWSLRGIPGNRAAAAAEDFSAPDSYAVKK